MHQYYLEIISKIAANDPNCTVVKFFESQNLDLGEFGEYTYIYSYPTNHQVTALCNALATNTKVKSLSLASLEMLPMLRTLLQRNKTILNIHIIGTWVSKSYMNRVKELEQEINSDRQNLLHTWCMLKAQDISANKVIFSLLPDLSYNTIKDFSGIRNSGMLKFYI